MDHDWTTLGAVCSVDDVQYVRVQGLGRRDPCEGCAAHPPSDAPGLCGALVLCGHDIWVRSATQDDSEGVGGTITHRTAFAPHHGDPAGPHDCPSKAYKPTHGGYPG